MAKKKKVNLIEQFIINNKLDFTGSGSDLNGNCVILAGYACYLEIPNVETLVENLNEFDEDGSIVSSDATDELCRVFKYAQSHMYANWWNSAEAKKIYTF